MTQVSLNFLHNFYLNNSMIASNITGHLAYFFCTQMFIAACRAKQDSNTIPLMSHVGKNKIS